MIEFRDTKEFTAEELERLFLSVNWASGRYPERLVRAMRASAHVISAWDGDRLIGLVRALDDGETAAFLHYLAVDPAWQGQHIGEGLMRRMLSRLEGRLYIKAIPSDPASVPFFEKFGFRQHENYTAMQIERFD